MHDLFHEAWEELAACCGEPLAWAWNDEELYFEATCSCSNKHYLEPTDAIYSHEESDEEYNEY